MRSFKFDRNVRFSYILPYGFVSPQALMLAVPASESAYIVYDPDKPMEKRLTDCYQNYQARMRMIKAMAELGYIEQYKRQCGKQKWEVTTQYRLTQAGLYFLTNTPDELVEEERVKSITRLKNRNKKEISYLPQDPQFYANRQHLYDLASIPSPTEEDLKRFEEIFLDSVEYDNLGLLALEPVLAKQVRTTSYYRTEAHYRAWKIANIEALFKVNSYLTSIDRRHLPLPLTPNIKEDEPIEIAEFCRYTLNRWYASHPASFLYVEPQEKYAKHIILEWKNTPAFYPLFEIDNVAMNVQLEDEINLKKSNKSYRHLCLGVAVGKEKNYIVHHTRPSGTPWAELIERSSIGSIQQRLNKENEQTPILGANRTISNALMICASVAQFSALFTAAKQTNNNGRKGKYRIGAPYDSVCIIPICPSGSMQLRGLMESSPIDYERAIRTFLLQHDGFMSRPADRDEKENVLSLTYKGTPVLLAHTMDWQKLFWAKELYDEGTYFYVSCYPEQVKYIKAIMPDVEFL